MDLNQDVTVAGRRRLSFSLRTLLIFALLISAYFCGRAPMMHRVERAEQERDEFQRLAEQRKREVNSLVKHVSLLKKDALRRSTPEGVDAGMMADAIEHQQRYFPAPTPELLKR
ncbi:MAG: hypothetical protein KY475_22010 [Planctomycetes bacterium]|nr:hypothetical protein [Planctomycetota bacterium]